MNTNYTSGPAAGSGASYSMAFAAGPTTQCPCGSKPCPCKGEDKKTCSACPCSRCAAPSATSGGAAPPGSAARPLRVLPPIQAMKW